METGQHNAAIFRVAQCDKCSRLYQQDGFDPCPFCDRADLLEQRAKMHDAMVMVDRALNQGKIWENPEERAKFIRSLIESRDPTKLKRELQKQCTRVKRLQRDLRQMNATMVQISKLATDGPIITNDEEESDGD